MTANVVALRENANLHHGEPDAEVIEQLEAMLADARSGYLRALATVTVDADRSISTGWVGHCDCHDMIAGAAMLSHRLVAHEF